uniref:Ewing's tumor-associated antigen 1-like n=1 Tax=Sparus aurata TaxID=8175 RepID=A0A671X4H4_SPAAU
MILLNGRGYSRYPGLNNGDSPGDVEPSQDIVWDSTSPTPANTVNLLTFCLCFKQDVKRKGTDSPLLQWIGDSAIPCTPDIPKPRLRKKQSRVDDLLKLARQFDENMQQDRESSAELNAVNNSLNQCGNTSKTKLTDTWYPGNVKDLKCPSSSDQVEAELHALFDSSTQKVSGRLSQGSSASACSQEVKGQPEKGSCRLNANICDEFDDDWENDDLLNDSFVLEMTQNPIQQRDTDTKTTLQSDTKTNPSACKPTANTNSAHQPSNLHWKPSHSALQELCPKPKATNRSTFKLEPNPHFQPKMAAREASKSSFTVIHPKPQTSERKSTTTKTPSAPQTDKITTDQKEICVAVDPVKDITDSLWGDDDDELLYQVCDSVERISNSQPQQASPDNCQEKDTAEDRQRQTTTPLPIDTAWSMNRAKFPGKPYSVFPVTFSHFPLFFPVFVTSQMTGKCSAAEIERKKQEALARRRLRLHNAPKP